MAVQLTTCSESLSTEKPKDNEVLLMMLLLAGGDGGGGWWWVMVGGSAATAPGFPTGEYKYRRRGAIGRQFSSRVRGGQMSRDSGIRVLFSLS